MSASDVAKYIIDFCYKNGLQVSNLKLQKILYFLWVEFYKQTGKYLFNDSICAWALGPVVPNVYREYCAYGSLPILPFDDEGSAPLPFSEEENNLIDSVIQQYARLNAYSLVHLSHQSGHSWASIYAHGVGDKNTIPFDLIKQLDLD